jgi:hypothetical protein
VGVLFRRAAVGGPPSVADAEGAMEGRVGDDVLEVAEFAGGAAKREAVGATGYGDAGGIVTAILETAEAFNDDGDDGLGSDIANNSTHELSVDGSGGICLKIWCGTFGLSGGDGRG